MSDGATGVAPVPGVRAGVARAGRRAGRGLEPLAARLEGTRGVWWPAALVGVAMLGLVLWQLAIPREYFTGTDSVAISSVVANVEQGQTLCVPGLQLPAETGRVQLAVFAHTPRFAAEVSVSAGGQTTSALMSGVPGPTALALGTAAIPTRAASPASVPATVCMTPRDGPMALGGMIGLQADQVPAQLDGAPVANRVAVWFLPPAGRERSLISSAGAIFSRAALFRPGIVGAWTYPFLLFAVLPLTWALSLLLLVRALSGRPLSRRLRFLRPGLALALVAFLNAGAWALITPAFNAPDEPSHFAYAQYFAETGHGPARVPGPQPPYSTEQTLALNAVDIYSQISNVLGRPPWLAVQQTQWKHELAKVPHPANNGGGYTEAASPHQPAYYALLAPAYLAVRSQSTFSQLTAMRLVSALLGALVAVCAFGIVRELLPRQRLAAVAAGLLVAFHPMFGFISGAVNNDNGINAAAALALYLVIRALRRGLTWRVGLALGATLAIAPFMKETAYEIYPAVAVGLVGVLWRDHRARVAPAWAAAVAAFVAVRGAWSLLQPVFYPTVPGQPGGGGVNATGSISLAEHMPGRFLEYLWELFLPKLGFMGNLFPPGWPFKAVYLVRGWASFGWYTWSFPKWVYGAILVVMIAAGVLALSAAARERLAAKRRFFELLVIALFPVCVLVAVEAAFFAPDGGRTVVAEQGRYIFPAIAALAAIAVAGTFGLGRRWHVPLATMLVVAMIGLSYASQLLTLGSFFT